MLAEYNEAQKKLTVETLKVVRLAEKMNLARSNFTDAAADEDLQRMEIHRMELHEIIDQLLDALLFVAKVKKDILEMLYKTDPGDWPKK